MSYIDLTKLADHIVAIAMLGVCTVLIVIYGHGFVGIAGATIGALATGYHIVQAIIAMVTDYEEEVAKNTELLIEHLNEDDFEHIRKWK